MAVVKQVSLGLAAVAVLGAEAARAEELPVPSLQVGAFGGGNLVLRHWELGSHSHEGALLPTSGGEFGLRLGLQLPFRLTAEGEFAYLPVSSTPAGSSNALQIGLNVTHRFLEGRWSPVIEAGFGGYKVVSGDVGDDFDPRFHFGVGLRALVTDRLALRVDVRDVVSDGFDRLGSNNIEALVGVDFLAWPTKTAPAPVERPAPAPAPVEPPVPAPVSVEAPAPVPALFEELAPALAPVETPAPPPDADGDGIADIEDACLGAPAGKFPDAAKKGCPADRDSDGIIDELDACVDIAVGGKSDAAKKGCPSDLDGDSVPDEKDACPEKAGAPDPQLSHAQLNHVPSDVK